MFVIWFCLFASFTFSSGDDGSSVVVRDGSDLFSGQTNVSDFYDFCDFGKFVVLQSLVIFCSLRFLD